MVGAARGGVRLRVLGTTIHIFFTDFLFAPRLDFALGLVPLIFCALTLLGLGLRFLPPVVCF